jgi:branched-subunit amino acid ABC-type transport system permease component
MKEFFPFIVAGLVTGSVYGLAATGLVLTYRTSGIFNFAHGAVAALGAYSFYQLRQQWGVPWPIAAAAVIVVAGAVLGYGLEGLARGLAGTGTAAKVVATIGVLTAVQAALSAIYGAAARDSHTFLPTHVFAIWGINVGLDQIIVFLIAVAVTGALTQYLRLSASGRAMRAVVDDSELLDLAGTSPVRVRRISWIIGSAFAVLSGILIAPTIGLDPNLLTLLVVQAFGAAAIGSFASLPLTFVGGLVVGLLGSLSTKYVAHYPFLSGFPPSVPFVVLFAVLVLAGRHRLVELGASAVRPAVRRARGSTRVRAAGALGLIALLVAAPGFAGPRLPVYSTALVFVLIFASLRLLVMTSRQVSLCHATFAAVGATSFSHLARGMGLPWPLALLLAGLVAVPVGAIVAIPAIRLSGVYLALATFGFAILVERLVFPMAIMFGKGGQARAPRPDFHLFNTTSPKGFYFVTLAVVLLGMAGIYAVGRSRLGRLLKGMADSPVGLATLGTTVNVTLVIVFCLSAFFAGVGGALFASYSGTFGTSSFSSFLSLTLLVVLAIAGPGEFRAPVVAAAALYIVPAYIRNATFNDYLPVLFGVSAMAAALLSNPHLDLTAMMRNVTGRAQARLGANRITIRTGRLRPPSPAAMAREARP